MLQYILIYFFFFTVSYRKFCPSISLVIIGWIPCLEKMAERVHQEDWSSFGETVLWFVADNANWSAVLQQALLYIRIRLLHFCR